MEGDSVFNFGNTEAITKMYLKKKKNLSYIKAWIIPNMLKEKPNHVFIFQKITLCSSMHLHTWHSKVLLFNMTR